MKTPALAPRALSALILAIIIGAGLLHAQESPPNNLVVSNRAYGSGDNATEAALVAIETAGAVAVNAGANVIYEAGRRIVLKPGFRAAEGSGFRAAITYKYLDRPGEDGIPVGLAQDSNGNGVPDLVEVSLGLDPGADNSADARLQNLNRAYEYDANGRLITAPERGYQMDAEGNIKGR